MRPKPQSYFRFPLSAILGSDASVRVLRELALHGDALSTTILARRTGITDQSVRNVLGALLPTGVLRTYGQGRAMSYRLDRKHPIGEMLGLLFESEALRGANLRERIREAAGALPELPLAVWLYGSVARGEDRIGSDLDLLLVVQDDADVDRIADAFRDALREIEEDHRLAISVVPVSAEDVLRLGGGGDPFWREVVSDAQPLLGPMPDALLARLKAKQRLQPPGEVAHG